MLCNLLLVPCCTNPYLYTPPKIHHRKGYALAICTRGDWDWRGFDLFRTSWLLIFATLQLGFPLVSIFFFKNFQEALKFMSEYAICLPRFFGFHQICRAFIG